jgi:anaphase-promoting complex subunit 1
MFFILVMVAKYLTLILLELDSNYLYQVFLATDIDGLPIICFLLHEQKILFAVSIQVDDTTEEPFGDIKPHMGWNITAFAAAPVVVTRPR